MPEGVVGTVRGIFTRDEPGHVALGVTDAAGELGGLSGRAIMCYSEVRSDFGGSGVGRVPSDERRYRTFMQHVHNGRMVRGGLLHERVRRRTLAF